MLHEMGCCRLSDTVVVFADSSAPTFLKVLLLELHKVSSFYVTKAEELEVSMAEPPVNHNSY